MMSNTKTNRPIALLFLGSFLFQLFSPNITWALTEGPGQPETTTFQPIGIDNMVDLFSGDFNYNIPLMNVPGPNGGYPINIHYNSTVGMEQEAGWVGLGWNINVGAVNRVMKGLPDDFKGTPVVKENNIKTSKNLGVEVELETELFSTEATDCSPADSASGTARIFYDNMIGVGMNFGFHVPSFSEALPVGMDLTFGTNEGLNFSSSVGFPLFKGWLNFNTGTSINSRQGVQSANFSASKSKMICRKKNSNDYKVGGGFGFSPTSYIPTAQLGFTTFNGTFGTKIGNGNLFSLKAFYTGEASVTVLKEEYKRKTYKGYGYGYSQNIALHEGEDDDKNRLKNELMDFNLEKEGLLSKQSPNSANVIPTSDIYSVSSQGFSGTFNHFRNDHGFYYSPVVESNNFGATLTGDFSTSPDGADIGAEVGISYSETYSGPIKGDIFEPESELDFSGTSASKEGVFYKEINGHNAVQDPAAYKGNDRPNRFKVRQMPSAKVRNTIIRETIGGGETEYDEFSDKIREHANNLLKSYTISELINYSSQVIDQSIIDPIYLWNIDQDELPGEGTDHLEDEAFNYNKNWDNSYASNPVDGFSDYESNDQVGAFVGVGSDGMTYEYGIPVYNNYQKEAVFSVEYDSPLTKDKVVPYDAGTEDTTENSSGDDHFFQSTELPPYAHSHLLTAIYSSDYVDIDNNGPSEDDLGYYTKFNYTRAHDDYKWRVPFAGANNMTGNISDPGDNKANYTFGSKEIYYLKSIETSTHIAVFVLSERADGMEVYDENQMPDDGTQIGSDALYKLDEIRLFAKSNPDGEPIQTVHFEYSYELCQGVPNFNGMYQNPGEDGAGKLTLKRIYTTHYGSYKGALSPYVFHYPEAGTNGNPDYNINNSDHWGNYKLNQNGDGEILTGYLGNNNFNPYTNQLSDFNEDGITNDEDTTARNEQAAAWLLRKIDLPGGGEISVDYEADDYAHVQNKEAKQFYKIVGFSKTASLDNDNKIKDKIDSDDGEAYYIHVELDNYFDAMDEDEAQAYWDNAIEDCDDIYFKTYMKLKKPVAEATPVYEYVNGYANLDEENLEANEESLVYWEGGKWYGMVPIKGHEGFPNSPKIHPLKWAGFNHLRYQRPDLFKHEELDAMAIPALVAQIVGLIPETLSLFSFINTGKIRGWCNEADLDNSDFPSFLRLHNGDGHKYGGGHRVKSITINDKWAEMSHPDENTSTYTLNYDYTLTDGTSSGVASYEPLVGGEENALKKVKHYKASAYTSRKALWLEYPMNESLYPQADVGYSRVVVQSTGSVESQDEFYPEAELDVSERLKSAKIVHEFYTYKNFPVKTRQTDRKLKKQFPPVIPIPCFGSLQFSNSIASQGYAIELTDMHGKRRSVKTYHSTVDLSDPDITPYAMTEYIYRQDGNNLNNENVPFFHPDEGLNNYGVMGRSVEMATYMNENRMIGTSGSNVDGDGTFIAGLPIFSLWIKADYSEAHTRLVTTNKIIRKQGILEKVTTKVGDSQTEALTLAYDKQTGAPVVVKHINNFDDPVYVSSIPAHWHYDDFKASKLTNGFKSLIQFDQILSVGADGVEFSESFFEALPLKKGDKIKVQSVDVRDLLYVSEVNHVEHKINFVDFNGNSGSDIAVLSEIIDSEAPLFIEIIETNKNNMLGTQIGHVVSLNNPLVANVFGSNWLSALNGGIQTAEPYVGDVTIPLCDRLATEDVSDETPNMYCGNFEFEDACGNTILGAVILIKTNGELEIHIDMTCEDGCIVSWNEVLRFTDQLDDPDSDPYHDFSNTYLTINGDANLFEIHDTDNQGNDEFYAGLDLNGIGAGVIRDKFEPGPCQGKVLQASALTLSDQWDYHYDLSRITEYVSLEDINNNPYLYGKRGNYRVRRNYVYQAEREQQEGDSHLDKDGVFQYYPFKWCQDFEEGCDVGELNPEWTAASTLTKYDAFNHALEERNALNIASAVLFSRDKNYVIVAAQNAEYREIAFEDFEALAHGADAYQPGNNFDLTSSAEIVANQSHTGMQSMKLDETNNVLEINYNPVTDVPDRFKPVWSFGTEKKYLLSFWVKDADITDFTVSADYLELELISDGVSIEGWQKIEVIITQGSFIPLDTITINYSGSIAYLDDIRIHPFECGIETYVYDYVRQRNVATLDNQNYATFYNYDEQGGLTQVKKETVRGILTLQTSRGHIRKNVSE